MTVTWPAIQEAPGATRAVFSQRVIEYEMTDGPIDLVESLFSLNEQSTIEVIPYV